MKIHFEKKMIDNAIQNPKSAPFIAVFIPKRTTTVISSFFGAPSTLTIPTSFIFLMDNKIRLDERLKEDTKKINPKIIIAAIRSIFIASTRDLFFSCQDLIITLSPISLSNFNFVTSISF